MYTCDVDLCAHHYLPWGMTITAYVTVNQSQFSLNIFLFYSLKQDKMLQFI